MGDQNEGVKVSNIVIGVLVFAVIAAAVIAFVMWGANRFNKAQSDLADTVEGVDIARFNQYDDNEVSGTDVLTAVKTYRNMDMCIFVSTKKQNGGNVYDLTQDASLLSTVTAYGHNGQQAQVAWDADKGKFTANILVADNQLQNNTNVTPLTTKGQDPYVNQQGKFWATLVYDSDTMDVAGILFRQTK